MISAQFLLTALVVVLAPGAGVLYVLMISLGQGKRAALPAALGCTVGVLPHLAAAMLGVAALVHSSAALFQTVKLAGVAYLLYLAWQTLRQRGTLKIRAESRHDRFSRIALRGILLNLLNPKLSLFFLALLPPFLSGNPATATAEMLALGAVFTALTAIVFLGYGLFAATARDRLLGSPRAMTWLNRTFAAAFAGLALRLAAEKA
ncbi:threonine/homoserine/homoserine lactone efflux protein [Rhodovulum imhoffii]|uniref:Threonine/homoserine/homoserine lactone efflux protein n=1 Tax=Rhodovulum imhoffii TaxID=365340 RepID=A0A2T5BUN9_9RHOB|nr:LysE family translocator [Rhodovulum imhoffii]MBK5934829.1 lysine transporter LysE [Rhodovulum imhoffii]PTN03230.1 threonine/homoserine/homoserine lactone efflux protein [Rhodovulum imhoffii]